MEQEYYINGEIFEVNNNNVCCWPGHVKRNTFVRCRNGRSLLYYRLGRDYEKHDVNHNIDQLFLVENVCDYQQSGALNAQLC